MCLIPILKEKKDLFAPAEFFFNEETKQTVRIERDRLTHAIYHSDKTFYECGDFAKVYLTGKTPKRKPPDFVSLSAESQASSD